MPKVPVLSHVKKVTTAVSLWQRRRFLFPMLGDMFKGRYKATILTWLTIILALVYLFSPFNILTDMIPVIGWIDDGFVIYFLLKRLLKETIRYEAARGVKNTLPL